MRRCLFLQQAILYLSPGLCFIRGLIVLRWHEVLYRGLTGRKRGAESRVFFQIIKSGGKQPGARDEAVCQQGSAGASAAPSCLLPPRPASTRRCGQGCQHRPFGPEPCPSVPAPGDRGAQGMFDDAEASRTHLPPSNGAHTAPRRPAGSAVGAVPAAEGRCSGTEASGVIRATGAIPEC